MSTITVVSRPGDARFEESVLVEVIEPQDFEMGDANNATSLAPVYAVGSAHGLNGIIYMSSAGLLASLGLGPADWEGTAFTDGYLNDGWTITAQRCYVKFSYSGDVSWYMTEGDGYGFSDVNATGDGGVTTSMKVATDPWFNGFVNLFIYATGESETFSVPVVDWWIETDMFQESVATITATQPSTRRTFFPI